MRLLLAAFCFRGLLSPLSTALHAGRRPSKDVSRRLLRGQAMMPVRLLQAALLTAGADTRY